MFVISINSYYNKVIHYSSTMIISLNYLHLATIDLHDIIFNEFESVVSLRTRPPHPAATKCGPAVNFQNPR